MTDLEARVEALEKRFGSEVNHAKVCRSGSSLCIHISRVAKNKGIKEGDIVEYIVNKQEQ